MITVEFTMDEAHATADTVRELLERNELSLSPIDREEAMRKYPRRHTG